MNVARFAVMVATTFAGALSGAFVLLLMAPREVIARFIPGIATEVRLGIAEVGLCLGGVAGAVVADRITRRWVLRQQSTNDRLCVSETTLPRRAFRFSLLTLFGVTTFVAVVLWAIMLRPVQEIQYTGPFRREVVVWEQPTDQDMRSRIYNGACATLVVGAVYVLFPRKGSLHG